MADIRAAAKALHDSREGLPDVLRAPWMTLDHRRLTVGVPLQPDQPRGYYAAANCDSDEDGDGAVAEHIARCASPDVTEATEKLLATVAEHDVADDRHEFETCFNEIVNAVEELAAAILREDR